MELVGALCLATDVGMGLPFEHGLQSTLIASRLADGLGVGRETGSQVYYACLLSHAGCTADAHVTPEVFGDTLVANLNPVLYGSGRQVATGLVKALATPGRSVPVRAFQMVRGVPRLLREQRPHLTAMCEVAVMLAERVGVPRSAAEVLAFLTDRWDGRGPLRRGKGEEIPLPMRIVHVASDASFQRMLGGDQRVVQIAREHAGKGLDPEIVGYLADNADDVLTLDASGSAWDEVLAREPEPRLMLAGDALDRAIAAMGNFADLISPHLAGHSNAVAQLADAAGRRCRLDARNATLLRRAALVHDLGRVAISLDIWQKAGPLSADEWEQVRLHPYYTERVLSRSPFLAALAPIAATDHERLDGSGYHRGVSSAELPLPARLLAAADAYQAMTEPRPYRAPLPAEQAVRELAEEAEAGRLDPDAVTAVIEAAGERPPRLERPAGLTDREAEVVGLLARGLQTKQVAHALGISAKTADRHVQNAYRKIGVSTRAAATLFAMEHGLVAWGELPIAGRQPRS
jgi:HD-GYP domain-containing protein (c-di-GMP phosphodiesterase class II)